MIFRESETVELKRELTVDIKKEVVAFANSYGGTVYIGIEDDGEVCGVTAPRKAEQQIASMLHDAIKPDVTLFTSITAKTIDGKQVIELAVQRGTDRPYYLADKGLKPSGVYIRLGTTSVPATETAIRSMIVETDGTHFEDVRSLNQNLTFEHAAGEFKQRSIGFEAAQLKTLGIRSPDCLYTNLGLLISDQCLHTIKIAVFQGVDKSVFQDRREFGGSVLKQIAEAYEYIDLNNHTQATFSGLTRIDARDYSDAVIREALLNAVIHRDYSFSGSVLVSIFADRIEFVSLGGLVPGLSIEDIMLGVSQPRNEKLADIFYRLRYVEAYGTGIGKIRKDYEGTGRHPTFTVTDNAFLLVLPNKNYQSDKAAPQEPSPADLVDEPETRICALAALQGSVTRKQLQDELGWKQSRAGQLLKQMEAKGLLIRSGAGRNTRYLWRKSGNFWR